MYSSRRYSVQRHIDNLHGGDGTAVPFVEYLVGRTSGKYLPGVQPVFMSSLDKLIKEAKAVRIRRVVEQSLPPSGDPSYDEQAKLLKIILFKSSCDEMTKLQKEFEDSTNSINHS